MISLGIQKLWELSRLVTTLRGEGNHLVEHTRRQRRGL